MMIPKICVPSSKQTNFFSEMWFSLFSSKGKGVSLSRKQMIELFIINGGDDIIERIYKDINCQIE